jgi:hypothetical protein
MYVRREVSEFIRTCDVLLHGMTAELSPTERELLAAYAERIQEKVKIKFPIAH